jgi:tetratricopeptide (TPR) repeat protein
MASIIPGYEYDIFISYRQKDNKYDRWVTEFVNHLKLELEATFKEEVSVYFDFNPHDGLLETHDVGASLKEKLKCLVFIPVISRTYCDPKSFAWEHEFKAFIEQASLDHFGLKVILPGGNVASRVLPVRIHEPDISDIKLCESVLGGPLRGVDFIYKSPGVNRPLRSNEDHPQDNLNRIYYRDQINKVANAINEIIDSLKRTENSLRRENWSFTELANQKNTGGFLINDESQKITVLQQLTRGKIQKERTGRIIKPGGYGLKNIYKYIFSVLFIALMVFFAMGRNKQFSFLGVGKSKRDEARSHVHAAVKYIDNKEYEAAKAELDLAFSSDPKYSYAWSSLAALNYKQGDLKNAVLQTIKAIEYDPKNSGAAFNMAFALHDKKDYNQAIHWYKQAIRIDSTFHTDTVYVRACSALGNLYNSLDQPIEAMLILNKAREQYPRSKIIWLVNRNLGNAYLKREYTDSALKYLELSRTIKPQEPETNLYLAKAYEASGNITKSIEIWQNYVDLETDTIKIREAKKHLKEITIKRLQEMIK